VPCSDTTNPQGCFRRHHYPGVPRPFTRRNRYPSRYPVNTHIPTTSTPKPPIPAPFGIFETVQHPHGIGPTKPVTRVPTQMEMATSTLPALSDEATAESVPPLHPAAPVQCCCGQLVRVSPTSQPLQLPTIQSQLFCTFPTHTLTAEKNAHPLNHL
jgi:hypothetical protein